MKRTLTTIAIAVASLHAVAQAQRAAVTLQVAFAQAASSTRVPAISAEAPVVAWLTPLDKATPPARASQPYRMVQKNKQFTPHLLVVPVGSTIEFPNEDPFFHNVFSLFNGKRFDLGLYQTHGSRAARFDREGVSYIFCNIHPEMGGIIVSIGSPYFTSSPTGKLSLQDVPPGNYTLHVWSERATLESTRFAERKVTISEGTNDLGAIILQPVPPQTHSHKNMFGEDYSHP